MTITSQKKDQPLSKATWPADFAPDESVAFDVAYALVRGGVLPEPLYRLGVTTF